MAAGDVAELKTRTASPPPQSPAADAPKVFAAIAGVTHALGADGISKTRKNQQQGYDFRGVDDVYKALSPALVANHLCIIPRVVSRSVEARQTAKGGILYDVACEVEFTLACTLDGSKITATTFGEAMDSGDKATNKAMSAAYKYMAFQTFCIATEGAAHDADAETPEETVAPQQGPTAEQLTACAKEWGALMKACESPRALSEFTTKLFASKKFATLDERDPPAANRLRRSAADLQQALVKSASSAAAALDDEIPF